MDWLLWCWMESDPLTLPPLTSQLADSHGLILTVCRAALKSSTMCEDVSLLQGKLKSSQPAPNWCALSCWTSATKNRLIFGCQLFYLISTQVPFFPFLRECYQILTPQKSHSLWHQLPSTLNYSVYTGWAANGWPEQPSCEHLFLRFHLWEREKVPHFIFLVDHQISLLIMHLGEFFSTW